MAEATRGFLGRARKPRDPRLPPGQYDTGDSWPVLTAEVTPQLATATWTFAVEGLVEQPTTWTWDEIHALPPSTYEGDIHCVTTWSKFGMTFDRRLGRHAARRGRGPLPDGHPRAGVLPHRLHHQPPARRRHRRQGVGGVGGRRRAARRSTTAARRGCSCPTCTSGRAPSGWPACGCSTTTSPASGSATATTTAATPGSSSATRATDRRRPVSRCRPGRPARGRPRRSWRSATRRRGPRRSGCALARSRRHAPGRPALRRAADRARRLHAHRARTRSRPRPTAPTRSS